jgi:C1A family cysteine protease
MPGVLDTIDGGLYLVSDQNYWKLMTFTDKERQAHEAVMKAARAAPASVIPYNGLKHVFETEPPKTGLTLPPSFSRREQMTMARDQGSRGTCTAFGTVSQHEFNWSRTKDFSEQYLYWGSKQIDNSSEGTWIKDAYASLNNRGTCLETTWPYTLTQPFPRWGGPMPSAAADTQAALYKAKQNWWIDHTDINMLKKCIFELGYVITIQVTVWWSCWPSTGEIKIPTAFEIAETKRILQSMKLNGSSPADGEHVICLCGYNDTTSRFEFKNSWRTSWGANGFGSIPYDYIKQYSRDAMVFQSA